VLYQLGRYWNVTTDVTDASDNWAIAVRAHWFFRTCELCQLVETIRFKMGERSSRATIFFLLFFFRFFALSSWFVISLYRFFRLPLLILAITPVYSLTCYYYHLYKYITISIHNSQLTITIMWSVVQPNVRRPLYVHIPSPYFTGCWPSRREVKKETRFCLFDNSVVDCVRKNVARRKIDR